MDRIVETELLLARKRRAVRDAVPGADFLAARVADELGERLGTVERRFERAAALFCQTDHARRALLASGKVGSVESVEADPALLTGKGEVADFETVPGEPESFDLAVSLLAMQDMNDLPGFLIQVRRALRPDGLFLGAMLGAGSLAELRHSLLAAELELTGGASPRVTPMADVRDAGALLQRAGLALPVADVETITVRYDDLFGLMRDLRGMGATSALVARSRRPVGRKFFAKAASHYADNYADADGRIRATFQIVWMSGWAPDASQQKPLKPGSAKVSLADALKLSNVSGFPEVPAAAWRHYRPKERPMRQKHC